MRLSDMIRVAATGKQIVVWAESSPGFIKEVRTKPKRVWTLFRETDRTKVPKLPIKPAHRHNAFLEDYIHDWNWYPKRAEKFKYYSRVTSGGNWILLEY